MPAATVVESVRKFEANEPTFYGELVTPAAPAGEANRRQEERRSFYSQILKAQSGDRDALGDVLSASWPFVNSQCQRILGNRDTADDLTQDVMVRIFSKVSQLTRPEAYPKWVQVTTRRMCLTHLRRLRRHQTCASRDLSELDFPDRGDFVPVGAAMIQREVLAIMQRTLEQLAKIDHEVIRLFHIEEKAVPHQ